MAKKNFKKPAEQFITPHVEVDKKDFANAVHHAQDIAQETAQGKKHDDIQAEILKRLNLDRRPVRTQGRKGCGKPRINCAFEPEIHDFISRYSERFGKSKTQTINDILYDYMKKIEDEE